ncbi:hypothetical protein LFM09_41265 [Lentzea alba]|uniref:hypothetical protein n=1 Tax=Lentzea alba TaxID=2714351 RepID=UPI0039BF2ADD
MRDDDVKPLLDLATSGQPPLSIDIDGIAARGRGVRRRRTVVAAAGSAAAVCGLTALVLLMPGRNGPAEPATQLPTSPATTSTSTPPSCFLTSGGPCPQTSR